VLVRLIVASEGGDRFLLRADDARIDCPSLDLRSASFEEPTLADLIETAMRSELGVSASYTGLLAFLTTRSAYELVVLTALNGPMPDAGRGGRFRMVLPHELPRAGLPSNLVRYFATAREMYLAELHTAGRDVGEQHAVQLGEAIQRARDRSLAFLAQHVAIESGYRGWAQYLDSQAIGLLSTAQGLLAYVHAEQRDEIVEDAARTLESMQNPDGGWQVRRALVGHESPVSITESTCYCLWALIEAGRRLESPVVRDGLAWLERAQGPKGGWRPAMGQGEPQVSATAPAYTAHAMLALLASGMGPTEAPVRRGCEYLRATFHPERAEP
jgi:hypothetical protein